MRRGVILVDCFIKTVIIGLFFINLLCAQESTYFEHITVDDGLSQSDINNIYQDKLGFMWFATHDGLNKYDGYNFKVYKPVSGKKGQISSNLVFAITGDEKGNLWVGTTGGGLNFFDRSKETFRVFKHDENNPNSLSGNYILNVFLDSKNRLWVGTTEGLNMADLNKPLDSIKFKKFHLSSGKNKKSFNNSVSCIYEDDKGEIWIGSIRGLHKLSIDENGLLYFIRKNLFTNYWFTVQEITTDYKGRLFLATNKGIYVEESDEEDNSIFKKVQNGRYSSILAHKNHIYVGNNSGLYVFDNSKQLEKIKLVNNFKYNPSNQSLGLSKNIIKSLYKDKTGIIWLGTNGGGINKFDPNRKYFKHYKKTLNPNSLSYDKIRSIYEDSNNTLWVGTEGGGLNMLQPKADGLKYSNFKNLNKVSKIFAITEADFFGKKMLLVGGESIPGLHKIELSKNKKNTANSMVPFSNTRGSVFSVMQDNLKNIWIGTYSKGIIRWKPDFNKKEFLIDYFSVDEGLSNQIVRNVYQDSKGDVWFATGDGLSRLKKEELKKNKPHFDIFRNEEGNPNSLSLNYILSLYESKKGEFWIGTFGGGLNKYIPAKDGGKAKFISYTEKDGLPNNVIKGILEAEDGSLWLSTNQGLSNFNPADITFKNYDINDGLQSNEFQELACLKRSDGEMLFGGINGFSAFYPNEIKENSFEAQTMITDFLISNKSIKQGVKINNHVILEKSINTTDSLNLNYSENSFSFEFAALHYAAPLKNKFAYKLEGFDKEWVNTTAEKRFATYTNLEPGKYTFMVKSSNNDAVWDSTPANIYIEIAPPFYRTTIAYIIYGVLLIGFLMSLWRYTIISTTKKHQLELDVIEKEKSEELQRIKLEFFTNVSHEFRTPLTLIKGPLEYLKENGKKLSEKTLDEQYDLMSKNTSYLLRLVNQLLDFRKINQGKMRLVMRHSNVLSFVQEIGEPFQFLARKKNINFSIISKDKELKSWFDHEALEKIMYNLLSNAFKFTPNEGDIEVKIATVQKMSYNYALTKKEEIPHLRIEVKDSGEGIENSKKNTIFERFYTEKGEKHKNSEGVGIGLSFTKSLIELHRGTIDIDTRETKGTNFIVYLPLQRDAYENIPEISCKEEVDSDFLARSSETELFAIGINDEIEDSPLSKSRSKFPILLVVDDNKDIRTFIKQALGDLYVIHEAENGEKGLQLAKKHVPNIILTDVVMPKMDGIQMCESLKSNKTTSHIPVLMLTAKSSEDSQLKGLTIGADDYISKPFSMQLLKLKLANILSSREGLRNKFNKTINFKPTEVTVTSVDEKFLKQAVEVVEKHMMNTDFSVEMLVKEMGMSRSNLYLKFKEITGLSSSEFIRNIRLKRAIQLLDTSGLSVKEIMYMTGFNTASYFSKCFKKQFGVVPRQYVRSLNKEAKENV
ncbi:hybrid sensor histidine kinase/response regulator transcription factor [uncultured Maribacter sp.]|uniref:hybrid sensor histidine kinase/response regulator transcription factor n=1 Tax=uncultured Maribacter sp. TaxID=431308 RepID=UPI002637CE8B|nr:hybrid sensor histidine kinase/response regulator transcription factor [uncultured Maribacter sp.]